MKFWDASAIVPLLVDEARTDFATALLARDPAMLVWWGSQVECVSALARLERERARQGSVRRRLCSPRRPRRFLERNRAERDRARNAVRFLRVHPLRAAGALQLGAAEGRPSSLQVLMLDERLADAARREGFGMVDPTPA